MAILAWVNLGVSVLLLLACVALYLDAKGNRTALAELSRSVARLAPVTARPAVDALEPPLAVRRVMPPLRQTVLAAPLARPSPLTPRTGTPVPPHPSSPLPPVPALRLPFGIDDEIATRYVALCDASRARGEPAEHCDGFACGTSCRCLCAACTRASEFLAEARVVERYEAMEHCEGARCPPGVCVCEACRAARSET